MAASMLASSTVVLCRTATASVPAMSAASVRVGSTMTSFSLRKSAAPCGIGGVRMYTHGVCRVEVWAVRVAQCESSLRSVSCNAEFQSARPSGASMRSASPGINGSCWMQQRGSSKFGGLCVRRFSAESVQWESSETSVSVESETKNSELTSSLPVVGADPPVLSSLPSLPVLPPPTPQSTLDLRELIASKGRELEILKSVLRDKEQAERLLAKHNIKLELADGQPESRWKTPEPLLKKADTPTMFGKLNLADFPTNQNSHYEKLQRRRKRDEMLKQNLRDQQNNAARFAASQLSASAGTVNSSLNPVSGKPDLGSYSGTGNGATLNGTNPVGGSPYVPGASSGTMNGATLNGTNAEGVSTPAEPYRPNAHAFDKPEGPYKSLADRLYEEQFGHPAPKNLKRTYPPGSFYDRCQKEKERKEREAAAAAAAASSQTPSKIDVETVDTGSPVEVVKSEPLNSIWEYRNKQAQMRRNRNNSSVNQELKPGDWSCPECSFHNFSKNVQCFKCQTVRP